MKKILIIIAVFSITLGAAQNLGFGKSVLAAVAQTHSTPIKTNAKIEGCHTVVINDTDEENGVFIIGNSGQKAAIDIPIAKTQTITINSIVVTLASKLPPTFVNFIFYDNILSTPEDPEDPARNIPNQQILNITDSTIESYEEVGYEEMHQFIIRKIKIKLQNPILLNGAMSDGRIWMSTKSDANAWSTTAHYETGEGVVGESLAMGNNSYWFQLLNQECLYELEAECEFLNVSDTNAGLKVALYPNPANDYFEYKNLNSLKILSTEVYDASGSLVKILKGNNSKISINELKSGVYFIKSKTSSNIILANKLIKK